MLLWLMFAVLTALALAFVLRPVFAATAVAAPGTSPELAVYMAQLADLDAQVALGRVDAAEYEPLRVEISRRILRADPKTAPRASASAPRVLGTQRTGMLAAALVPIACLGLYVSLGSPGLPARPFAANVVPGADASGDEWIAKIEARLAKEPKDARGWELVAPLYLKVGRFADAAEAYRRVIDLAGETPKRLGGFAEASMMAHDGIITDEARLALEKLAAASPGDVQPKFWLALAKEQDGQREAAAADYRALLSSAPADAPWRALVEQHLAAVTGQLPPRGPSEADVKAAAAMSPADRQAMIVAMVENLAAKLKADGHDLGGWQRLIVAYTTLKEPGKARAALADAKLALAGQAEAMAALDVLAKRLGIAP